MNTLKYRALNWALYTTEEKRNIIKTLGEITISGMFYLCLKLLGWNPNDKDKYQKLADNSLLTNHLIYQLMAVKSESEQFIPIKGMGLDEWMRLINNPSIAFTHLGKWYRLLGDIASPTDQLTQKSGFWDKGDYKLPIQLAKITGFIGGIFEPIPMIKNFNMVQNRVK